MADRLIILAAATGAGLLILGALMLYRRRGPAPDRLDMSELGLELMDGCCAFIVFGSPSCRPCKTATRVVEAAAAGSDGPTEVLKIDATEKPDIALHCGVRAVPTVFLITASGHVIERWRHVPDPTSLTEALALL